MAAPQRRAAILAAATEVFAAEGYAGASIRKIADGAGVTLPVLYDHFASKKSMYIELLEQHAGELIAATSSVTGDSPQALMRASVEAFFTYVERHEFAWRMLFREPPADAEIAAAHARVMSRARGSIAGLFALTPRWECSAALDQETLVELLAEGTKSAINGLAAWWWEHREVPRDEVVALTMDLLFVGIERLRAG